MYNWNVKKNLQQAKTPNPNGNNVGLQPHGDTLGFNSLSKWGAKFILYHSSEGTQPHTQNSGPAKYDIIIIV